MLPRALCCGWAAFCAECCGSPGRWSAQPITCESPEAAIDGWPDTSTVKYDRDELQVWDEHTGSYVDPATGEVLLTWDVVQDRP